MHILITIVLFTKGSICGQKLTTKNDTIITSSGLLYYLEKR